VLAPLVLSAILFFMGENTMTERPYRSLIRALAFLVGFVAALVLCTGNAKAGDREQYVRPDVAGNLDFQMDNMPDWMIYPSLSALLQGGGIDCTVIGIFDNGTFHGDHYVTIECEGDKMLLMNATSTPVMAFSCFDPTLPKGLACLVKLPYDERHTL
jgi:hypothetical protein